MAEPPRKNPSVTESLPNAWRKSRGLYPYEVNYIRKIFKNSLRYDKVRITRDHWFSKGSTRVVGNTINFTSDYGGEYLFEDTPEQGLNDAGLLLLGHEIGHVWQYQNGGWAYAGESLTKQAAGFYATGSRNTAYDWQTAVEWDLPWEQWGPEQQAESIDQWNQAMRVTGDEDLIEKLQPYVEKARRGEGVTKFSPAGTAVCVAVGAGIGYLVKKCKGAQIGAAFGFVVNLPWNAWFLKKPGLKSTLGSALWTESLFQDNKLPMAWEEQSSEDLKKQYGMMTEQEERALRGQIQSVGMTSQKP